MTKSTHRALLSSVVALLICLTMLIGTTFAWFTDTAQTAVNTIKSGTLDVDLQIYENGKWVTATGKTLNFLVADEDGNKTQGTNILWEPGCTYELPELRVVNNGDLALKYKVVISGIKGDAELNEVIDWTIKVDDTAYTTGSEIKLAPNATSKFTLWGSMQSTADNTYQDMKIEDIAITVVATQDTAESDSFGNEYDENAEYPETEQWTVVTTEEALKEALSAGGNVRLGADITCNSSIIFGSSSNDADKVTATLDLNGKTLKTDIQIAHSGNLTIIDSKTEGQIISDGSVLDVLGKLTVNSGTIVAEKNNTTVKASYGGYVTINGGSFKAAIGPVIETATIMSPEQIPGTLVINDGVFHEASENNNSVSSCGNTTINGGTFYGTVYQGTHFSKGELKITGGTFANDPTDYVADDYTVSTNSDGKYVVRHVPGTSENPIVATTDANLQSALEAGGYIKLGGDITDNTAERVARYVFVDDADSGVDNSVTLDLNGYTLNRGIRVEDGRNLTIIDSRGTGKVFAGSSTSIFYNVLVFPGSSVTISGGTFENYYEDNPIIELYYDFDEPGESGRVSINGGTFEGILAEHADAVVSVTGGTFSENPKNMVVSGYVATKGADGKYTVGRPSNHNATVTTEADLIEAFKFGGNIKLGANIEVLGNEDDNEDDHYIQLGSFATNAAQLTATLDLNGYTLTTRMTISPNYELTIIDTKTGGTIKGGIDVYQTKLTVNGGTIEGVDSLAIDINDSEVTISGGTLKNTGNYNLVYVPEGSKLTITGGTVEYNPVYYNYSIFSAGNTTISGGIFNGSLSEGGDGTISITGGTFANDPTDYVADDYITTQGSDGKYTVSQIVYTTVTTADDLETALNAGGNVRLGGDIIDDDNYIALMDSTNVTLDLNGHTLTGNINVPNTTELTVNDSLTGGKIKGYLSAYGKLNLNGVSVEADESTAVFVYFTAEVTISGGTFNNTNDSTLINVECNSAVNKAGKLTITDGTFAKNSDTVNTLYSQGDTTISGGTFEGNVSNDNGTLSISGGTFEGWLNNYDGTLSITGGTFANDPTDYVADDYITTQGPDGKYTVVPIVTVTTENALRAALNAGGYIKLDADITTRRLLGSSKDASIDLNGHTLEITGDYAYLMITSAKLTVSNGTIKADIPIDNEGGTVYLNNCTLTSTFLHAVYQYGGTATIENCTFNGYVSLDRGSGNDITLKGTCTFGESGDRAKGISVNQSGSIICDFDPTDNIDDATVTKTGDSTWTVTAKPTN